MGERNSGKSSTWNDLFGRTVKTGKYLKELHLTQTESVDVFLVSGSPEERGEYVGDLIVEDEPRIVLCSMQYNRNSLTTIDYFIEHDYSLYVQWINPGFHDQPETVSHDRFGLIPYLHENEGIPHIHQSLEI